MAPPLGPTLRPNTSRSPSCAVATFCCRSRRICTVRIASRSCAASSKRSCPAASTIRSRSVAVELVVPPLEQQPGAGHRHPVLLLGADLGDARRDAALDVVLEARPRAAPGDHLVARADAEQPVRQRHRPARQLGRQERAGVEVARLLDAARHQHPRKRLAGRQLQVRVVLVVAQQDVVLRRPLLDQVVLERERLHHRVGDDHLEAARSPRAARRAAGSARRRPDSCGRDRAATAPCRRRARRRRRSPTRRPRAARAAARSVP